jgi:hypothetical protein
MTDALYALDKFNDPVWNILAHSRYYIQSYWLGINQIAAVVFFIQYMVKMVRPRMVLWPKDLSMFDRFHKYPFCLTFQDSLITP